MTIHLTSVWLHGLFVYSAILIELPRIAAQGLQPALNLSNEEGGVLLCNKTFTEDFFRCKFQPHRILSF
jgi:hypothetical protein